MEDKQGPVSHKSRHAGLTDQAVDASQVATTPAKSRTTVSSDRPDNLTTPPSSLTHILLGPRPVFIDGGEGSKQVHAKDLPDATKVTMRRRETA
jgi:hypothetical protein